jgi:hypothetical protein
MPRVTRKPQQERSPSATRYKLISKCTLDLSTHLDDESIKKMNGKGFTQLKGCFKCKNDQESEPNPDIGLK